MLAPRVTAIATTFSGILDRQPALAAKATQTGNPIRPAVLAAAATPYAAPTGDGRLRLLIFGGSQGARVMADVVPDAIAQLDAALRARLGLMQQARDEDRERVVATYGRLGVAAEIAPFFTDLPARMADAHLVISRSGATTVAELAAIGRPSILVPLPGALDQDQFANASVLQKAGGAILLIQEAFTPERLAQEIVTLAAAPQRLAAMAQGAKSAGATDAADRLADLVVKVARLPAMG
jgi:UDP-N-acetylglucosamine--N-acetylmuramyl-(pentapeptide) pyrophosphoryl-undecaprenol N-acetylglucosamine transferase